MDISHLFGTILDFMMDNPIDGSMVTNGDMIFIALLAVFLWKLVK